MTYKKSLPFLALLIITLIAVNTSCKKSPLTATAELTDTQNNKVGTVILTQMKEGVKLRISIDGLEPGVHAFHIHEKGDFTPPDFKNAGGHFNPFEKEHGIKNPKGPHAGDLPNIFVNENRILKVEMTAKLVTLEKGKKNSLFKKGGTSIVIHKGPDDYVSNPAGAAGPRIAGGIIKVK